MKAAIITNSGLEFSAEYEIKEKLGKKTTTKDTIVFFDVTPEELVKLSYISQSAHKIIAVLEEIKATSIDDFSKIKLDLKDWMTPETKFAVRCLKEKSELSSSQIESAIGEKIAGKVDLKNPELTLLVYIYKDYSCIGIDITNLEMNKRQYKIYNATNTLKGTTAYPLLVFSEATQKDKLLDVNCRDGTIVIEAAHHYTNFPVRYYEKEKFAFIKLKPFSKINFEKIFSEEDAKIKHTENIFASDELQRNVAAAQKNSKVAGLNKDIQFTRTELEWLDIRFKEKEIDKIVTNFIWPTKQMSEKDIQKRTKELFYQAEYVLKNNGSITLITRTPDLVKEEASKNKFKLEKEKAIMIGEEKFTIIKLKK